MGKINKPITRRLSNKFQVSKLEPADVKVEPTSSNGSTEKVAIKLKPTLVKNKQKVKPSEPSNDSTVKVDSKVKQIQVNPKSKVKSNEPNVKKKRNSKFYMKCLKSREEKGLILLSAKIETKIYKLKKALQKKGISGEEIKDIIRKKRREEELKMRKEEKHLCFKCRQPGHSMANCPQAGEQDSSDICYFCGSAEHRLFECLKWKQSGKKEQNLPYAKCFICGKKGHLTRSCAKNENGVYPKGGKCIICGSVNHMVKDCSKNKDKEKPEEEMILKTYGDVSQSIDADDFEMIVPMRSTPKGPNKMVKF